MIFRWLHERVAYKPWRPWVERALLIVACFVGLTGKAVKGAWQAVSGAPKPEMPAAGSLRRIVVIRPDRIGDAVLSTPALRALRQAAPQAHICVIASPATAPLMQSLTFIDQVVILSGDRLMDWWRARRQLLPLRRDKQDLVIALQSSWPAALLSAWLKGNYSLGYDAGGMGWLFAQGVPYPFLKKKAHQVEVNLHLLASAGIPVPSKESTQLEVPVAETGRAAAEEWLRTQGYDGKRSLIVIHPGSRSRYTQWAPERFAAVADRLASNSNYQVVLLCGPHEELILDRVLAAMKQKVFIARDLQLEAVVALLARSELFIGNATGTMHLASAVCKKVVAVIGGTHPQDCPERWGPWGEDHRVVHKTPEETIGRSTWNWVGPEGLQYIMPDDVLAVLS